MDVNGGQITQTNGNPVFPGSTFTGPLLAGNVFHSDGSGTLAGTGESNLGTANVGYVLMAQMASGLTWASSAAVQTLAIVIPAQSQITGIQLSVTTAQSGGTIQVGTTAGSATTLVTSASIATAGIVTCTPTSAATWDNIGATDIAVTVTPSATGAGVVTITVFYVQGNNLAS